MALDWHRKTGKSTLDGFSRSLARKGLDFLDITGVTIVGGYNHSSKRLIDGLIRNRVEESLGAAKYEEICNQRLSFMDGFHNPQKIVPVQGSSSLGDAVARPSLINHDYLVLEIGYNGGATSSYVDKIFIRAEKSGHPPEKAGILLTVDANYEESEAHVRLFTTRCLGKKIALREILHILADHNPEYSSPMPLHQCKQQLDLSAEELSRLQMMEDTIETRIASNHLKRLVHKGKKGLKNILKTFG